ncbi:MAG: hypothetical protein KKB31_06760 [Nanoarchaeota archaeon]|nr:hypothetical protein [Nanoarchaeota archaeon]
MKIKLNRILDVTDPLRLIGREPPLVLSSNIMASLRGNERVHYGVFWTYEVKGPNSIVAKSNLRYKSFFYDGNGRRAFTR